MPVWSMNAAPADRYRGAGASGGGGRSPLRIGDELIGPEKTGAPVLYENPLHMLVSALNGAGKATRFFVRIAMTATGQNLVSIEPKGTLDVQTYEERARFSDVWHVCPLPVFNIRSHHFNPISRLNDKQSDFRSRLYSTAAACVDPEPGVGQFFASSAEDIIATLAGWVVVQARANGRVPYFPAVWSLVTEPDRFVGKRLVGGFKHTMQRIAESHHPVLAPMAGRFVREHGKDELAGAVSTTIVNLRFLGDPAIMRDMLGLGVDLSRLCTAARPQTIYYTLPAKEAHEFRRHARLFLQCLMHEHFQPSRWHTLILADELPVTIGRLQLLRDMWAVVREYRMQIIGAAQSMSFYRDMWGEGWEGLVAQCGALLQLGPCNDDFSAELLSKRGGVTTIPVLGYSETWGGNRGGTTGSGSSQSSSGRNLNQNEGTSIGSSSGGSLSITQTERRALLPQDLMDMRPGDGRLFLQGMGSRSVPLFAPHYWRVREPWAARVGKNPLYQG